MTDELRTNPMFRYTPGQGVLRISLGGTDAAARRSAAYPLPMDGGFMAQLVLPLDLSATEARRLQQFIDALVVPWRSLE